MPAVRLVLVLLCLSAPASADVVPSPTPSTVVVQPEAQPVPPPAFEHFPADMERRAAQLRESQLSLRRTVLGMLSPAQLEFVAATIGRLAIAPDPDVAAATQRIDAALSPAQRQAVLRLVAAEAARREAMFMDMVAQSPPLPAQLPPLAGSAHPPGIAVQGGSAIVMSAPGMPFGIAPGQSAGATLLMLLTSPGSSPFRPAPVMIRSSLAPASGSGP